MLRNAVDRLSQTVVMVTHDPVAAGYADRVIFLGDGQVSGELSQPTTAAIIDHMKTVGD